jgi:hypothetical protein
MPLATKHFFTLMILPCLNQNKHDEALAAQAVTKCGFVDIEPRQFVTFLNHYANDGINVNLLLLKF